MPAAWWPCLPPAFLSLPGRPWSSPSGSRPGRRSSGPSAPSRLAASSRPWRTLTAGPRRCPPRRGPSSTPPPPRPPPPDRPAQLLLRQLPAGSPGLLAALEQLTETAFRGPLPGPVPGTEKWETELALSLLAAAGDELKGLASYEPLSLAAQVVVP